MTIHLICFWFSACHQNNNFAVDKGLHWYSEPPDATQSHKPVSPCEPGHLSSVCGLSPPLNTVDRYTPLLIRSTKELFEKIA